MAHVVILGAGTGDLPCAYEMRCSVAAIASPWSTPPNISNSCRRIPWAGVGWRKRADITFPLRHYLSRRGIDLIADTITAIVPADNRLELKGGGHVIRLSDHRNRCQARLRRGARHRSRGGHTHSVCTIDHAELASGG